MVLTAILLASVSGKAAKPAVLPEKYDGSMMPYDFNATQCWKKVIPDTLTPCFVNYLGRHGARFLSSPNKTGHIKKILEDARHRGYITAQGEKFLNLIAEVEKATGGQWGALDSIGVMEQRRLATEMEQICPALFNGKRVDAIATYVPRVVMSMYQFCHTLAKEAPEMECYTSEGPQNNRLLRYFSVDKEYKEFLDSGDWEPDYEEFVKSVVPVRPAVALVSDRFGLDGGKLRKLTLEIYGVLQSLRAAGLPAPTDEWMSSQEYGKCWEAANLNHYLRRTATWLSAEPALAAAPLLMSFIEYGDSAATGMNSPGAFLRFGHAETLMPLLSLMRVPGCHASVDNVKDVASVWKDYDVVPLGANLMVISLKGASGEIYAAMRLNGRFVDPLGDGRKVVKWNDLKGYWLENLRYLTEIQKSRDGKTPE